MNLRLPLFTMTLVIGLVDAPAYAERSSRDVFRKGPHLECKCVADSSGNSELCYGYVFSISGNKVEFYEGESGGSGRYVMKRKPDKSIYAATIITQTRQRLKVSAVIDRVGKASIYNGTVSKKNLAFTAACY